MKWMGHHQIYAVITRRRQPALASASLSCDQ